MTSLPGSRPLISGPLILSQYWKGKPQSQMNMPALFTPYLHCSVGGGSKSPAVIWYRICDSLVSSVLSWNPNLYYSPATSLLQTPNSSHFVRRGIHTTLFAERITISSSAGTQQANNKHLIKNYEWTNLLWTQLPLVWYSKSKTKILTWENWIHCFYHLKSLKVVLKTSRAGRWKRK